MPNPFGDDEEDSSDNGNSGDAKAKSNPFSDDGSDGGSDSPPPSRAPPPKKSSSKSSLKKKSNRSDDHPEGLGTETRAKSSALQSLFSAGEPKKESKAEIAAKAERLTSDSPQIRALLAYNDLHAVLVDFYKKHNPHKLGDVDANLEKYKGAEYEMFEKLARKYGVDNPLTSKPSQLPTKGPKRYADGALRPGEKEVSLLPKKKPKPKKTYDEIEADKKKPLPPAVVLTDASIAAMMAHNDVPALLTEFYKKHNFFKLNEVPAILAKYKGNEFVMFEKLARKYDVPNPITGVPSRMAPKGPRRYADGGLMDKPKKSAINPFDFDEDDDEDDDDDEEKSKSAPPPKKASSKKEEKAKVKAAKADAKKAKAKAKEISENNPFGDDDDDEKKAAAAKSGGLVGSLLGSLFGGGKSTSAPDADKDEKEKKKEEDATAPKAVKKASSILSKKKKEEAEDEQEDDEGEADEYDDPSGLGSVVYKKKVQKPVLDANGKPALTADSPEIRAMMVHTDFKLMLTAFYTRYNSEKLPDVDANLKKYKGDEFNMFEKLARKYKVPNPMTNASSQLQAKVTSYKAKKVPVNPDTLKEGYKPPVRPTPAAIAAILSFNDIPAVLLLFYKKHNPTKLSEIPAILEKYKGAEFDMFEKLARKYGVNNPLTGVPTCLPPVGPKRYADGGLRDEPKDSTNPFDFDDDYESNEEEEPEEAVPIAPKKRISLKESAKKALAGVASENPDDEEVKPEPKMTRNLKATKKGDWGGSSKELTPSQLALQKLNDAGALGGHAKTTFGAVVEVVAPGAGKKNNKGKKSKEEPAVPKPKIALPDAIEIKINRKTKETASSNPFGDDDEEEEEEEDKSSKKKKPASSANPFGDDDDEEEAPKSSKKDAKKASSNPFGDDEEDDDEKPNAGGKKASSSSGLPSPFLSKQELSAKKKIAEKKKQEEEEEEEDDGNDDESNPYDDDKVDAEGRTVHGLGQSLRKGGVQIGRTYFKPQKKIKEEDDDEEDSDSDSDSDDSDDDSSDSSDSDSDTSDDDDDDDSTEDEEAKAMEKDDDEPVSESVRIRRAVSEALRNNDGRNADANPFGDDEDDEDEEDDMGNTEKVGGDGEEDNDDDEDILGRKIGGASKRSIFAAQESKKSIKDLLAEVDEKKSDPVKGEAPIRDEFDDEDCPPNLRIFREKLLAYVYNQKMQLNGKPSAPVIPLHPAVQLLQDAITAAPPPSPLGVEKTTATLNSALSLSNALLLRTSKSLARNEVESNNASDIFVKRLAVHEKALKELLDTVIEVEKNYDEAMGGRMQKDTESKESDTSGKANDDGVTLSNAQEEMMASGSLPGGLSIATSLAELEAKRRLLLTSKRVLEVWWSVARISEAPNMLKIDLDGMVKNKGKPLKEGSAPCPAPLDSIFTDQKKGIEGAAMLKYLREIGRSVTQNPVAAADYFESSGKPADPSSKGVAHRFASAVLCVQRLSDALESRLLGEFSAAFERGGVYEFPSTALTAKTKRAEHLLDYDTLRRCACALSCFDEGRNINKQYVQLVAMGRFADMTAPRDGNDKKAGVERLSVMLKKVESVVEMEFRLINYVFRPQSDQGENLSNPQEGLVGDVRSIVAMKLLERIITDPVYGLQGLVNELLSVDVPMNEAGVASADRKIDPRPLLPTMVSIVSTLSSAFAKLGLFASQTMPYAKPKLNIYIDSKRLEMLGSLRSGYLDFELRGVCNACVEAVEKSSGVKMINRGGGSDDIKERVSKYGSSSSSGSYVASLFTVDTTAYLKKDDKLTVSGGGTGLDKLLAGVLKDDVVTSICTIASEAIQRAISIYSAGSLSSAPDDASIASAAVAAAAGAARARARTLAASTVTSSDSEGIALAISAIWQQVCVFFSHGYLLPAIEIMCSSIVLAPPIGEKKVPIAHQLGVPAGVWAGFKMVKNGMKKFEDRVWKDKDFGILELLRQVGQATQVTVAKEKRRRLISEVETAGRNTLATVINALIEHCKWILLLGETQLDRKQLDGDWTGVIGKSIAFFEFGPYDAGEFTPSGNTALGGTSVAVTCIITSLSSHLEAGRASLNPASMRDFWDLTMERVHDMFNERLLNNWHVSIAGAILMSRDVAGMRGLCFKGLSGEDGQMVTALHDGGEGGELRSIRKFDVLSEIALIYVTPPAALVSIAKGLLERAVTSRDELTTYLARRSDWTIKGVKRSQFATDLIRDLKVDGKSLAAGGASLRDFVGGATKVGGATDFESGPGPLGGNSGKGSQPAAGISTRTETAKSTFGSFGGFASGAKASAPAPAPAPAAKAPAPAPAPTPAPAAKAATPAPAPAAAPAAPAVSGTATTTPAPPAAAAAAAATTGVKDAPSKDADHSHHHDDKKGFFKWGR